MPISDGVCWSRAKLLASASILAIGVLGYLQVNNSRVLAGTTQPISEQQVAQQTINVDAVVAANTNFGFKLFSEIIKKDSGKNVFVSPSSVALALAMVYNGASGSTSEAIAHTLELQGLSLEDTNSGYKALQSFLDKPDEQVQLNITNSLWARQDFALNPEFIQKSQDFYKAKVSNLDFKDPNASDTINNWVSENTSSKISKIVDVIKPLDVLFLINTIYFKGNWTEKFDPQRTTNNPFYLSSGEQKQHPMMSQTSNYQYYENEKFQAISLPYGKLGRISLYIFLPQQNSNLKDFYTSLNTQNWKNWLTKFSKRRGFIRLPRFKTEYGMTLNDTLKALGMESAFSDQADFSALGKNLFISQVQHKTFVEVNEDGTEAAAATSIGVSTTAAFVNQFEMIVNRPFFCAIRDNRTGTVLFMGSIEDPQS